MKKFTLNLSTWITLAIPAVLMCFNDSVFAQLSISGTVVEKSSGKPLTGAHIRSEKNNLSVLSDATGQFKIGGLKDEKYSLKVTFVGFQSQRVEFVLRQDTAIGFSMESVAILGEEVNIVATRAQPQQPATYSMVSGNEIKSVNLGRDMPYLLQTTPSLVTTSDAGNGVGYTGMNIRGTDLTRINVTINGIPVNDAESQGVWFVDLPDLASSTENIQIQRGVGTSTNGAGAFGASVNIKTSDLKQEPYGELDLAAGSYGTFKSTLRFGTGLINEKISVDGRLSFITSNGYIDRASSNLKSYFLSAGYFGKNTTLKLLTFSGFEKTYQAWEGVPKDSLLTNRTYNPAGEYIDKSGQIAYYDNQTDNYQQDNYQMIFSQRILKNWNLNLALHYTKGRGYYENYDQSASFNDYGLNDVIVGNDTITNTDLVNRKILDNDFYGFTFSSNVSVGKNLKMTVGGGWNQYYGRHFGKIIWAEFASDGNNEQDWYYNTGLKNDFNVYSKFTYSPVDLISFYADLQYRYVGYKMSGTLDDLRSIDQQHQFNFINPKGGLFVQINEKHQAYFSFGMTHREPSRNNYKDADPERIPTYETLFDYELGYHFGIPSFHANINAYYMAYSNQLVLTGEINKVGEAIMVNVPHSYRLGIEVTAGLELFKKLQWNITATLSKNKIKDFTSYIDNYDSTGSFTGQVSEYLGETDLSFSPNIILGSVLTYTPLTSLSFALISRYTGQQYIDNTSDKSRSLGSYFVNSFSASYSIKLKPFKEIGFNILVNNFFNQKYESNAWVYQYYYDNVHYEVNGYFPQAPINVMFGITLRI